MLQTFISFQIGGVTEKEIHIRSCEIKVEESVSDPQLAKTRQDVDPQPQHQRDIRTVLVKEERTLVLHEVQATPGSRRRRWNVEPVDVENTYRPRKCWRTLLNQAWMTTSPTAALLKHAWNLYVFFFRSACSHGGGRFGARLWP